MPKVQVIVTKGDRSWDSIRDTDAEAMFRVTEHMCKDNNLIIVSISDMVQWKLIFGKGASEGKRVFEEHGFTVKIKPIKD